MTQAEIQFYGVREQFTRENSLDQHAENIQRNGYTIVKSGFSSEKVAAIETAYIQAHQDQNDKYGLDFLTSLDEHNTIRALFQYNTIFQDVFAHEDVLGVCRRLISPMVILNQQNGIINPPNAAQYNQGYYHRDLPYQHFVSSRPLAINALFCLDPFTKENGATFVVPGSHKEEVFPSEEFVRENQIQLEAEAGDFVVMDCMLYHSGGVNQTNKMRRAINNVFTIAMLKQQINLSDLATEDMSSEIKELLGVTTPMVNSVADYYKSRMQKKK